MRWHLRRGIPSWQFCGEWCNIVWCNVVWCIIVWCNVVWCNIVWCNIVWCNIAWCNVVWCNIVWCNVSEMESLHPEEGSSRSIRTVGIYEQTERCNIHDENISLLSSQHRGTRPESKMASSCDSCRTHRQKQNVITSHTLLAYSLVQTCNLFVTWILKHSRHDMPSATVSFCAQ